VEGEQWKFWWDLVKRKVQLDGGDWVGGVTLTADDNVLAPRFLDFSEWKVDDA
jgi:hypothetical protein